MTIPNLMNCPHNKEGWCLDCVGNVYKQLYEFRDIAYKFEELFEIKCKQYDEVIKLANRLVKLKS